jgi:hypothetical protein
MARHPNIIPTEAIRFHIPRDLRMKVDLFLFSTAEKKIPYAAHQRFYSSLIRWFFDTEELDLSPYLGTPQGMVTIRGRPEAIRQLETKLKESPQ